MPVLFNLIKTIFHSLSHLTYDTASTKMARTISKKLNTCSFRRIPNPNLSDRILIASNIQNFVLAITSSTSIIAFNGSILFGF